MDIKSLALSIYLSCISLYLSDFFFLFENFYYISCTSKMIDNSNIFLFREVRKLIEGYEIMDLAQ